jgi:hypothetical protein
MKEITNDKSSYTFEQRIVVSDWEHEQPRTGKNNEPCVGNFPTVFRSRNTSKEDTAAIVAQTFCNREYNTKFKN